MTSSSAAGRPDADAQQPTRRHWAALGVVCIAQLMVVLDATIVTIALPTAQQELGFGDESRQWVVSGYALAFGGLLLLGGRLAARIGYRRSFLIGSAGFAAASALGGVAGSVQMLVAARGLQGVFAALLAPATLALITTTFSGGAGRRRAFGIYGALSSAGGGIGLLLGGVLTEHVDWRWCLLVNVVFAALAVVGALAVVPDDRPASRTPVDVLGALLGTGGTVALVLGLAHAETGGWVEPRTWAPMLVGALLLVAFTVVQHRGRHPLLPLRVVTDRDRGGAYLALLTSSMAMFGVFLFLTYYLQETLGFGAVASGLAYVPMLVVIVVCSTVLTNRLLHRFGARLVIVTGMLMTVVGLLLLTRLDGTTSYAPDVLPAIVVLGLGFGLTTAPATDLGTARITGADAGAASALVNTAQQIGGSIGLAVLSTIAASSTAGGAAAEVGYAAAYLWSAVIVTGGALVTLLLTRGRTRTDRSEGIPSHV